ncbi:sensor histidine kinase [Allonocardiopsis opalescens]|uniref:histidine kinase n=1 Tax=Allonocardiopsis opalescens TaxID=1144618 RepID=A0A2T0QEM6_9ACTN|nr:HAMP domain-containing sensor histidine kinase [Allonocardiopsis opalescens]PRY02396.1 two-component system sensor histidine kinase BaeS [Allonocardiopsis opalescens]
MTAARRRRRPRRTGVALRHSLLARLLASSVLVAACSITATAWLAAEGASESISVAQGETLAVDTRINDTLLGYAAQHADWSGVGPTVHALAEQTGRRIVLTTENRVPIADSADGGAPLPARIRASSAVDPLAVDVSSAADGAGRIDPRAVGPFALPEEEGAELEQLAEQVAACFETATGLTASVERAPSGRPFVEMSDSGSPYAAECAREILLEPTETERAALAELNGLLAECLEPAGLQARFAIDPATGAAALTPVSDVPGEPAAPPQEAEPLPAAPEPPVAAPGPNADPVARPRVDPRVASCADTSRRAQLDPYVAPSALLFIDDPADGAGGLSLSRDGWLRIAGAGALVLVLTVGVSVAVSTRLVRPVRSLTDAVQRMRAGEGVRLVEVRDSGEIGRLAAAFNEMAEHLVRLERQRKAMISDVSHELRTPLSNLRGWLEAAQDGVADLSPERTAMLVEETLLLQRIIDDLRDLAMADAGRLDLALEPVDLGRLLAQAAASHSLTAEAAGVRLTADAEPGLRAVADRARLLQAVGNLVGNAIRHTPAAGAVTVRARGDGEDVLIEVADTGTGIAPEHLPYVFDRFWRADKSRNRRTGGSGLGLAIVRNIAELHGGSATVRTAPGGGALFTVRLPVRGPAVPEPAGAGG